MSDHDKMMAFGNWLTSKVEAHKLELFSLSINDKIPESHIRRKAGHLESATFILGAFRELYNGELRKFERDYLGIAHEIEEDDKESQ